MNIVIIPMDERPPNYQIVKKIGELYGQKLEMPDINLLGYYTKPGECDKLAAWLLKKSADVFIISIDMLLFGGLIASRDRTVNLDEAFKRLEVIKQIKNQNPEAKIFLSSIIRRASVSVSSTETKLLWEKLNNYLWLLGNGSEKKANDLLREFPEDFLRIYYELRERNHMINRACIELVREGVADLLVLAQEDTFVGGPQTRELELLNKLVQKGGIRDRVFIHNGADEVIQELVAFASLKNNVSVDLVYDCDETERKVMDFEDRGFGENVKSHLKLLGFQESLDSEIGILVAGSSLEKSLDALSKLSEKKKRVFVLDVFNANGSNPDFVEAYLKMGLKNIWGYSAWNTASNSLGTLLAVVGSNTVCQENDKELAEFYLSRILDDHLYQGLLRNELERMLKIFNGNAYCVSTTKGLFERFRDEIYMPAARELLEKYFYGKKMDWSIGTLKKGSIVIEEFTLPWDRTFECKIELRIT